MHNNAFGIRINKEKLPEIIQECNKLYPLESLHVIHSVDWELLAKKLKIEYVSEVAQNYAIFGNNIPEPQFVIKDLRINSSNIMAYGENQGFIRFVYNGITFVKKYCPAGDYKRMTMTTTGGLLKRKKDLKLNLICQFVLNTWEDRVNPEVKILYYDVCEDKGMEEDFNEWVEETEDRAEKCVKDSEECAEKCVEEIGKDEEVQTFGAKSVEKEQNIAVKSAEAEEPVKKKRGRPRKIKVESIEDVESGNVENSESKEDKSEEDGEKVEKRKVYSIEDDFDW